MTTTNQWLTRREVATLTGFSPKTLENWAAMKPRKGPKCFRVAGRVRYSLDDVTAWQQRQTVTAA
jgi:predicted DNA-binding transcriptional regulator AlpA